MLVFLYIHVLPHPPAVQQLYSKTVLTRRFWGNNSAQMDLLFVAIIIYMYIMAKHNSSQFLLYKNIVTASCFSNNTIY